MGSNICSKIFNRNAADIKSLEQNEVLLKGPRIDGYTMHLNKGQDDEMQLCCFKKSTPKTFFTYLLFVLSVGIVRLLFHWIPHLFLLATSVKCKVEEAEQILITEIYNGKHKIYHVKPIQVLTPESVAKMKQEDNLLNHHHTTGAYDSPPALSVHFEKGEFRDLDRSC